MNKKIILAKIMPCGAQLIKTVKDWGDGLDQRIAELTADGYEIIK